MIAYLALILFLVWIMPPTFVTSVLNQLRGSLDDATSPTPGSASTAGSRDAEGLYQPSPVDIVVVRIMLTRSQRLPPDLVDAIFDHAEYWAHSTSSINWIAKYDDRPVAAGQQGVRHEDENRFLLRSYPVGLRAEHGGNLALDGDAAQPRPLVSERSAEYFSQIADYPTPKLVHPVRKIVFRIRSRDQGWSQTPEPGSKNPFDGSWTWFEAGLEKFEANESGSCTFAILDSRPSYFYGPLLTALDPASVMDVSDLRPVMPTLQRTLPTEGNPEPEIDEHAYEFELLPNAKSLIQKNKKKVRKWQEHVVVWQDKDHIYPDSDEGQALESNGRGRGTGDGEFVRSLKMGDVVTIWAKARFPLWINKTDLYEYSE